MEFLDRDRMSRVAVGRRRAGPHAAVEPQASGRQPDRGDRQQWFGQEQPAQGIGRFGSPLAGHIRLGVARPGGVAYLPQQQQIDRQFPIRLLELVRGGFWGSRLGRSERQARLRQVLADWGLLDLQTQGLHALSGGELQRALLARMSLTDAQLLLLDEPEAALDETGLDLLWQHLRRWQQQGRTLVLVSHNLDRLREKRCNALRIARSGCVAAPIDQLLDRDPLGRVA